MCDRQIQYADTLVSPQSQGTILMMLAWFFACLLALCTVTRIIARYKLRRHPQFPVSDDAIVVTAALCALGSTLVISTAVDSGLGKLQCLLDSTDIDRIQVKIFVATILSVLALSIPKCSVLIFFYRVAHSTLQRIGVVTLGCLVLLWTIAVISGTVFQCAMPQPWTIWTGKCIPLATFHITTTIASTILDTTLLLISLQLTWTQTTSYHYKTLASFLLSLRLLLIATSILTAIYTPAAYSRTTTQVQTLSYIPYAILTMTHTTLAPLLSYTLILTPLRSLLSPKPQSHQRHHHHHHHHHHKKTPSDTTTGSSTTTTTPTPTITKEPLPSIQASMSHPNLPSRSRWSGDEDELLPEVRLPVAKPRGNKPRRPPRPSEAQRPDLSMFTMSDSHIRSPQEDSSDFAKKPQQMHSSTKFHCLHSGIPSPCRPL
ncbi:hypothetical protein IAQ61_001030, partial [Plenodomus lingam]|uniref:uncharacterized protein n=1 Tax=Leptosphaeria maculans TaxID=5022 RepID=UPI003318C66E